MTIQICRRRVLGSAGNTRILCDVLSLARKPLNNVQRLAGALPPASIECARRGSTMGLYQ